jgi:YrbI family 3-deoxy-D-manno-octulosonate 8-phosphate phosphatase
MAFDFDGIFTTNAVLVTDQGNELVQCSRFDGMGISAIKKLEIYPVVISAEKNVVVKHRCEKIKIDCFHGVDDKIGLLQEICKKRKVKASEVFYMGNDINDLACLNFAEISVTVPDAHPYVFSHARYMTSTVGGHGAVREMCDIIGRVRKA